MTKWGRIAVAILMSFTADSGIAFAQSAADQYKQFGSIAGVTEACLQSQSIPQKLRVVLGQYSSQGADQAALAQVMVKAYNDGYKSSIADMKIWNVSQQAYNEKPINCQDQNDLEMIKKFEAVVLNALDN